MGQNNTSRQTEYGVYIGNEKKGETRIIRNPQIGEKDLASIPYDNIDTILKAFERSCKLFPNKPFLGTRKTISKDVKGEYEWKTYTEISQLVDDFAAGMITLNLCPKIESLHDGTFKFFGIYSKNREEWTISDLACHKISATVVTFYDTLGENSIEFILNQTKLTTILLEEKSLKKIIQLKKTGKAPELINIITIDLEDKELRDEAINAGFKVFTFEDILKEGKNREVEFTPATGDTIASFCYTSGTTGIPKGAMLPHKAILTNNATLFYLDVEINEKDVYISYLPLAHIMERGCFGLAILQGMSIGYYSGNPLKLLEDIQLLKPTVFLAVPRIFQRLYENISAGINSLTGLKKRMADMAINSKLSAFRQNGTYSNYLWDSLIFSKARAALGGRVKIMLTGSAPISPEMLEFLKICFSCPILEGYGQTEATGAISFTLASDPTPNHVGGIIPSLECKLVDVEELNYRTTDKNEGGQYQPRGEICVRGNCIFKGYFNDKENTKKTIDEEGWLHTGDVGTFLPNNALKIIDRVKNIFKLQQGEYIAPEKLEKDLAKSKYVQQIYIYGESLENYIVALVVPEKDKCVEFLKQEITDVNIDNVHKYFENKILKEEILRDLEKTGKAYDFKGFEIVKKIYISNEVWTIENNLLTPTMKLKRNEAKKQYGEILKKLYHEN